MINVMLGFERLRNLLTTEDTEHHRGVHINIPALSQKARQESGSFMPPCQDLWADDYFVGGGGEAELNAVGLVAGDGFAEIEGGEFDFADPRSGVVVVGAGVENAVDDGVVGNFFAVTVAKVQDRDGVMRRSGRVLCCDVFLRPEGGDVGAINHLRLGIRVTADLDEAVAAQFDEKRLGGRRTHRRRECGWRLCGDDGRLRYGILRSGKIIRIKGLEERKVVRAGATIDVR